MGLEWVLIAAGVTILIAVLARRRLLQQRLFKNKEALSAISFDSRVPDEIAKILSKAPLLKSDGKFAFKTTGCIPFSKNFDHIRVSRRIYFVEPTLIEVLLVPDPANIERKLAVAVTVDSRILGYVPTQEAGEMHKYLLANSGGVRAKAKIYLGSRPEYNGLLLDFAKPLRLEPKRRS